jgi:ATP-binding cassette subfamily C protein CydCD
MWHRAACARTAIVASVALGVATALVLVAQAWLLASGIAHASTGVLTALAAIVLVRAAVAWLSEIVSARCAARAQSELRLALLERAGRPGGSAPGVLSTLATRGIDALDPYFARYVPQLALAGIVPAVVLVVLVARDPLSAAIVLATLPLVPLFMALVGASTRERMDERLHTLQRLSGHFLDVVAGLGTLKVFGRAGAQAGTIGAVMDAYRRQTLATLRSAFLSSLVLELLASFSMALVAVAIGLRLLGGSLDFETALLVLILSPEAYLPLRRLGESYHAGAEGGAALAQIAAVLDAPAAPGGARVDVPDPAAHPIVVDDLRVVYPDRGAAALDGLSFTVAPGEVLAVAGPSGSGKSTLLQVLLGLERPAAGRVRIGDVELGDLRPAAWHDRLAWVPQRPHLFAGTIADNVRVGRAGATDAAVWRALADARLAETVGRLPDGIDTPLAERGAGLSAGERQRIALARAFVRDAPLLLLDEPTAGLDGRIEAELLAVIQRLVRGRTVILVAHRPQLLALADRVLELAPAEVAA